MEVHIQPITCPITNIVIWEPKIEENAKKFSRYLSDYEELQILGKGSDGVVARCRNLLDNKVYAAKKITLGVHSLDFETIQREVDIVSGLKHQNVVQYYTSWTDLTFAGEKSQLELEEGRNMDDGSNSSLEEGPGNTNKDKEKQQLPCLYIVQECCERTLSEELLKRGGNMTWNEASAVFTDITRGLLYIHGNNIVHGDLNPLNILVKDKNWKIGDFGIARKQVGNCFGDEQIEEALKGRTYDAPEDKVDFKRDIFSLGMILVELIAQPRTVAEKYDIFKSFKKDGKLPEKVSGHPLKSLALKLLENDPAKRPSAAEVLRRITL
ncbi:serine/threonine-protein kinase ifkC [Pyrus ussuriensis x Pyrus communis]|uniref:non-specific serine/threonine protein kinase n=1 Tax=Pyrus ussuriensis x Pyrus communis TaxID=2448454 RepID=A0A5N5I0N3_9ROSA|nr:serine/threonine-protein kinase ifkC [Pyrus ussuriensis x Pyrus communis]